jgi:hypothetical protein
MEKVTVRRCAGADWLGEAMEIVFVVLLSSAAFLSFSFFFCRSPSGFPFSLSFPFHRLETLFFTK